MAIKTKTTKVFAFDEKDKKQIINYVERLKKMFLAKNCYKLADEMENYYDDVDLDTFARALNIPFINEINDNIDDDNEDDIYSLFKDEVFPWISNLNSSETRFTYEDFDSYGNLRGISYSEALENLDDSIGTDEILSWIVNEGPEKFGTALRDEFVNWFVNLA
ncbi:MAG: hypothetical protein J6Z11_09995 [Candidatus Riflebacteria bacterium]|nr:hypothetical protein [Candidatus Riflebacteria bacterium]